MDSSLKPEPRTFNPISFCSKLDYWERFYSWDHDLRLNKRDARNFPTKMLTDSCLTRRTIILWNTTWNRLRNSMFHEKSFFLLYMYVTSGTFTNQELLKAPFAYNRLCGVKIGPVRNRAKDKRPWFKPRDPFPFWQTTDKTTMVQPTYQKTILY